MKLSIVAAAALALTGLLAGPVQAGDQVTVVYTSYVPPKHPTSASVEKFFKKVEEETGGSIRFEPHFGGSLLGAKDIPAGVRDGLADAGYMLGIFVPSEMPVDNYIGDFAMMNDDPFAITGAVNELIIFNCPQCKREYEEEYRVKYLGGYSLTPYLFQCKEERRTLADFRGVKTRGFSSVAKLIKQMGAVPVGVTTGEMYEALQRGVIDCTAHMAASQRAFSLGEVAKYVITDSLGGFMGGSLLNLSLEKWNALSPDQRQVIVNNLPTVIAEATHNYMVMDDEIRAQMEAKGNKFYEAAPDLAKFIADFREGYIANHVVEDGRKRGVENPEQIKERLIALKAKWQKLLDERGRDQATFEKLLWEEVYSRFKVAE